MKCICCGKDIELTNKTRPHKYCSDYCRNRARGIRTGKYGKNGTMTKICVVCGEVFETTISHKITCSDECSRDRKKGVSPEQKAKRKEYDRQKYLQKHPDALTQAERNEVRRKQKEERLLAEAPERERRKQEQKRREEERARLRAEKEKKKQENIAHWLEYEAEHTCDICGKKYIAHHPFSKYCSKTCARRNTRTRDSRNRYKNIIVDKGITLPKLAKRDHNQCQICGLFVDWNDYIKTDKTIICGDMYPSIDHILPISLGGKHSWNNVQLAHRGCNTRKSNVHVQELKEKDYVLRHSVPAKQIKHEALEGDAALYLL